MVNIEKLIAGVHSYLAKELAPLLSRLKAVEARSPEKGDTGPAGVDGLNGKNGEPGEVGLCGEKGAQGGLGEKGDTGAQGEKGEKGEPGPAGLIGEKGLDGSVGLNGVDGEKGLDGKDGADGVNGKDGSAGRDGKDGANGLDGKSLSTDDVMPMFESLVSKWALDFERRAQDTVQKAIDKIQPPKDGKDGNNGTDGKPGLDGLGFKDLDVTQVDDRTIKITFDNGDKSKEFICKFAVVLDQGVFSADKSYEKGDGVTYGGSFWIAQKASPNQKPGAGDEWRLAVKRGKDAK